MHLLKCRLIINGGMFFSVYSGLEIISSIIPHLGTRPVFISPVKNVPVLADPGPS
jgi:hypothetical protein